MKDMIQQVARLHSVYVMTTGQRIALNAARERTWWDWIQFRKEEPFTEADLRAVVAHIRRGIGNGTRNHGALKFRNLIGCPDYFEEDLADAQARSRKPGIDPGRAAALTATGRDPQSQPAMNKLKDPDPVPARTAEEVISSKGFQDMVKFKESLK